MDRYDYINLITEYLRGRTGMNFQRLVREVFKEYNTYKGKTYEMPDAYGGDKKNDGWVVEDALFYQIYAPARNNDSLKKNMQKKFSEDLEGLLENVYKEKLWNGFINEFIFLVNTFDNDLPEDSERYYEKEVKRLQDKYNVTIKYRVVNLSYVYDALCEIQDISVLEKISAIMRIKGMADYNAVSEEIMTKLIMKISANMSKKYVCSIQKKDTAEIYERISSVKKISINKLDDKREDIESIISNLDVVEAAIKNINQDILFENQFERVKNFIVSRYEELAKEYQGVELYLNIIKDIASYAGYDEIDETSVEFLIVYIFDKCDIFEKE